MDPLANDIEPQDLLTLARDHEAQEMRRYRRLAFRFLSFGEGLSRLMASLGIACEHRRQACEAAAARLGLPLSAAPVPSRGPVAPPGVATGCLILGQEHAVAVLKRTQAAAEQSHRFTRYCHDSRLLPELSPLWRDLTAQKAAESQLLKELLAAYEGAARPGHDPAWQHRVAAALARPRA